MSGFTNFLFLRLKTEHEMRQQAVNGLDFHSQYIFIISNEKIFSFFLYYYYRSHIRSKFIIHIHIERLKVILLCEKGSRKTFLNADWNVKGEITVYQM